MPAYDPALVAQANQVNYYIDSVLQAVVDGCDSTVSYYSDDHIECRDFSRFKIGYEMSELLLNNLVTSFMARDKGKLPTDQVVLIKNIFETAYAAHAKKIVITPEYAYDAKKVIDAAFSALLISEMKFKKSQ